METNFLKKMGTLDIQSYINVLNAYSEHFINENIFEVGFNTDSGYVYIALELNVQIISRLGMEVEYLITNFDSGEEYFFNDYSKAIEFIDKLNK